jgi:NADH dehydrogenase
MDSGLSYAILRPTVLFGKEDILINNIAWLLRYFPFFGLPGDGSYCLQPVYVDDLAGLAIDVLYKKENILWDAVGPEIFTFREMVEIIGETIGHKRPLLPIPPRLALLAAQFLSLFVRDVMLTPEEVDGLMANLLVSKEPLRCKTRLTDWLAEHKNSVGVRYASELKRHYERR